jgi:hypothetical protein
MTTVGFNPSLHESLNSIKLNQQAPQMLPILSFHRQVHYNFHSSDPCRRKSIVIISATAVVGMSQLLFTNRIYPIRENANFVEGFITERSVSFTRFKACRIRKSKFYLKVAEGMANSLNKV